MFNTIVAGTDGSRNAEDALRVAAHLARSSPGSEVHVIAAFKPLSSRDLAAVAANIPDEFRMMLDPNYGVDSTIESARSIFRTIDVEADFAEVNGDPTDALLSAVDVHDADLIVVGSRGEGPVRRAMHGSVSTNVLHHAPCSVLVVKSEH